MPAHEFRRTSLALVCCCGALLSTGCWRPPRPTAHQSEVGLVYMLPGIEGGPWTMKWAYDGLRAAGVGAEIRAFDWDRGAAFLDNLTDYQGNLQHAAAIADEIVEFERRRPGAPVDVVGYSGGGGLAILAVEALPQQVRVRNVLLVQAAISPDYDLTSVLSHIDGRLVNFYCPTDWVILGLGTQVFGTIDRTYTKSAGKDGFDVERAAPDRQLRGKIEQVRWTLEMLRSGHAGNHTGILMQQWNQRYLAPYLVPDNQSR